MIHILSGRRLQISSSPEQAAPLLPRSGFVQSVGGIIPERRTASPGIGKADVSIVLPKQD